jgi:hypothetical protein
VEIHQQKHGYAGGHKLLGSSVKLDRADQDVIDRISDIAGAPHSGETVPSYITAYPLPSKRFYVLARTWYDTAAPRAGCVLTHSLLIPLKQWEHAVGLNSFLELHEPFAVSSAQAEQPLYFEPDARGYPPASGEGFADLAEALFLEERRPIVWFTDTDALTGMRVLEALWPVLRRQFSLQTYALKPRQAGDRLFDLMIAPQRARSRFGAWDGRRVEGDVPGRSPWTGRLVKALFGQPLPSLEEVDPLRIMQDESGDVNALRLSLLWNQLSADAQRNPRSKLALLDVLEAIPASEERRWELASPIIQSTFSDLEADRLPSEYLSVLLGKIPESRLIQLQPQAANAVGAELRRGAPVVEPLRAAGRKNATIQAIFLDGLILALQSPEGTTIQSLIRDLDDGELAEVIDRLPRVVPLFSANVDRTAAAEWKRLARALKRLPPGGLDRVFDDVVRSVSLAEQAPLLSAALKDADQDKLMRASRILLDGRREANQDLTAELLKAWKRPSANIEAFREFLLSPDVPRGETTLLPQTFTGSQADFFWILKEPLEPTLRTLFLNALESLTPQHELIRKTLSQTLLLRELLHALDEGSLDEKDVAKAVSDMTVIPPESLDIIGDWLSRSNGNHSGLTAALIDRTLPVRSADDRRQLSDLFEVPSIAEVLSTYPKLIPSFFPADLARHQQCYSLTLEAIGDAKPPVGEVFVHHAPGIVKRLADSKTRTLSAGGYEVWAHLIRSRDAGDRDKTRMSLLSLDYVLDRRIPATFPVLEVALPEAYPAMRQMSRRRHRQIIDAIARFMLWEKAPAGRSLAIIFQTDDPDEFIEAILSYSAGKAFLGRAIKELGSSSQSKHRKIADELSELDLSEGFLSWLGF